MPERGAPELVVTWIVTGPSFRAAPGSVGDDTGFAADGAVAEPPHAVSARTALARSPPHAARVACDLTGCLHMTRYSSRNSGFRVATGGAIGLCQRCASKVRAAWPCTPCPAAA